MKMRITAVRYSVRLVTTCANQTCEGLVPVVSRVCQLCPGADNRSEPQLEDDLLLITDNGVQVEGDLGGRRTTAYVAPHILEGPDRMMDPFDMWLYVDETVFPAGTEINGQGWYKTGVNTKTGIIGEVGKLHFVNWRLRRREWPPKHPDAAPKHVLELSSHETRPADDSAAADPSRFSGPAPVPGVLVASNPVRLLNVGRVCVSNSLLQVLAQTNPLRLGISRFPTLKRALCHLVLSMAAGRTPSLESIVGAIRERCPLDLGNQSCEDATSIGRCPLLLLSWPWSKYWFYATAFATCAPRACLKATPSPVGHLLLRPCNATCRPASMPLRIAGLVHNARLHCGPDTRARRPCHCKRATCWLSRGMVLRGSRQHKSDLGGSSMTFFFNHAV